MNAHVGGKHRVAMYGPCSQCLTTMEGAQDLQCGRTRALLEMRNTSKYEELRGRGSGAVEIAGGHEEGREYE